MIAIDTNVLLRYLLQDDKRQSAQANALITSNEKVLVTNVMLSETVWTLCGNKYNATQLDIVITIQALFEEPNILFENSKTIWRALDDYVKANGKHKKKVDFPDALILNCAKSVAHERDVEFAGFYTFDKAAQRLPGALAPQS